VKSRCPRTLCAFTLGWTASALGLVATTDTGVRSRSRSKARLEYSVGFTALVPVEPSMSVWPSGAARATASAARLPAAPVRFSTTKGAPSASPSRAA
jgi:hypothetical protein